MSFLRARAARGTAIFVLTVSIGLSSLGCSSGRGPTESTTVEPQSFEEEDGAVEPTEPAEPEPIEAEASGETSRGRELTESRCIECHGIDRVYSHSDDRAGWTETVNTMVSRGARLDEQEQQLVIDYLLSRPN